MLAVVARVVVAILVLRVAAVAIRLFRR